MTQHGKKYLEAKKHIAVGREYSLPEAIKLLKQIAFAKFNETVELHARLGIDPRQSDQQVRTTVLLPAAWARPCACWSLRRAKPPATPKPPAPITWRAMR